MFDAIARTLAQLTTQAGLATVAAPDADPDTVGHIHSVEAVDEHNPADCGYDYTGSTGGSPWDPLCWTCAQHNIDQQWVRSCLAGSGMPLLVQPCEAKTPEGTA